MSILNIGVDVGSTTVKVVVTNYKKEILFSDYRRHYSDTKSTIIDLLNNCIVGHENDTFKIALTGSGAISMSEYLGVPFIQEVIACKNAVINYKKNIDVAIELGGEDAKIVFFTNGIEQRMNGSCAGGTGAFLDQMAVLLNTDTIGLNEYAKNGKNIYSIASRCGVFAKTDIQPLLNEGVCKEDIALSIMQAVVNQTISGLACGKTIKGNVIFLGGPLNYLSMLRERFIKTLDLTEDESVVPDNGHLFVSMGAIISNKDMKPITFKQLKNKINLLKSFNEKETDSLSPLFNTKKEYEDFINSHNKYNVINKDISKYKGDAFLGIDAGSTTAKLVLIDSKGNILYSDYKSNMGTPVDTLKDMLIKLYDNINDDIVIRMSGSTGYGEILIKTAFNLDINEIETIAHYRGAKYFKPNIDSIIDIGGQDMKYIRIKDDNIDTIMLNEACSSGCGSFIETLSKSLNISISDFVSLACSSKNPVDLGSRCTVFMNSKIKQTQKEGRPLGDIFAGLSYSVIKNALQKVMKIRDAEYLGNNIIVQGGTFLNDAVLRAFEIIINKEVVRPNIAGLMGAYGVALIGLDKYNENKDITKSTILSKEDIINLKQKTVFTRCNGCENKCALTINNFNNKRFVSGNRCERMVRNGEVKEDLPNMFEYKYNRLFNYEGLGTLATRGDIGIPRVLNMYEDYPFWFTLLTNLGFNVILSDSSSKKLMLSGMNSIPSESVCYPAKLVHGHIINLINKGVKTIFYPCIMYSKKEFILNDNCYNCPIVQSYSESIKLNEEELSTNNIKYINPFLSFDKKVLIDKFLKLDEFKCYKFCRKELSNAIDIATEEQSNFREDIINKGKEIINYLSDNKKYGIVLAGRPYHLDKEVNHGIDTLINSLGLAVLTEDSICYDSEINSKLRVVDQWTYHSRVYHAADAIVKYPFLELVNLNSFGCGLDAVITDQTEEILKYNDRLYTTIKIDEINNLGAIKIRLRSLIATMKKRNNTEDYNPYLYNKNMFKKSMQNHTILVPDMSPYHMDLIVGAIKSEGYNLVYLDDTTDKMIEIGLKYVNNDACYPAIIVIGQLINALKSGKYDLDNTTVAISQTGGGCRATNYIGLIRKALKDAGLSNIPILSFNFSGLEKDQGFKITIPMFNKLLMGVIYGDLLMKLLMQTEPYEIKKGESIKLYNKYHKLCSKIVGNGSRREYKQTIKNIVSDFNKIKIENKDLIKVGIVGEILIKYHKFGNNDLVSKLQNEGAEVVVPELMGFVKYCIYNNIIKSKIFNNNKFLSFASHELLNILDYYEIVVKRAIKNTRFNAITNIYQLSDNVDGIISNANQTGEGWFLTAEIVELLKKGVNNVLCVQPFACLPNHIVGKSVIKRIKELYPDSNISAIDYDPGSSVSNQSNRIKLMLSVAKDNKKHKTFTK